jgi:hypothetical protein
MTEDFIMRKHKFNKLFTVALPVDLYNLVKELSDQHEISMGEVVRSSIQHSMNYNGDWMASKNKPSEEVIPFCFKEQEF